MPNPNQLNQSGNPPLRPDQMPTEKIAVTWPGGESVLGASQPTPLQPDTSAAYYEPSIPFTSQLAPTTAGEAGATSPLPGEVRRPIARGPVRRIGEQAVRGSQQAPIPMPNRGVPTPNSVGLATDQFLAQQPAVAPRRQPQPQSRRGVPGRSGEASRAPRSQEELMQAADDKAIGVRQPDGSRKGGLIGTNPDTGLGNLTPQEYKMLSPHARNIYDIRKRAQEKVYALPDNDFRSLFNNPKKFNKLSQPEQMAAQARDIEESVKWVQGLVNRRTAHIQHNIELDRRRDRGPRWPIERDDQQIALAFSVEQTHLLDSANLNIPKGDPASKRVLGIFKNRGLQSARIRGAAIARDDALGRSPSGSNTIGSPAKPKAKRTKPSVGPAAPNQYILPPVSGLRDAAITQLNKYVADVPGIPHLPEL